MPVRWLIILLLLTGVATAQKLRDVKAELKVVKCVQGTTASQTETVYELTVTVTNTGQGRLAFSNNNFVLVDAQGKRYVVTRGRYPARFDLAPGEQASVERMFYSLPNGVKPVSAQLILGRGAVGEAKL